MSTPPHFNNLEFRDRLCDRIRSKVNVHTLRAFLKLQSEKHQRGEIVIGSTKEEMSHNLNEAISQGLIPIGEAIDLLREGEENGHQTILYYRPKSLKATDLCRQPENIAKSLFGKNWRTSEQFPLLPQLTEGYAIVDFREKYLGKENDWLLKIYTYQTVKEKVRQVDGNQINSQNLGLEQDQFAVIYQNITLESVCVLRWNDHETLGLLEIRIEFENRSKKFEKDVGSVWKNVAAVFSQDDFEPWELHKPLLNMLRKCEDNNSEYELGVVSLTDSGDGVVKYHTKTEFDSIAAAPVRLDTIKQILDDGGRCDRLVITWMPKASKGALLQSLRTYAGSRGTNELVISAQISSKAVDYVTDRLRLFGA